MIVFVICIMLTYCLLLFYLYTGLEQSTTFKPEIHAKKISFSILIPFRNESEYLPILLQSLSKLNYPTSHFEVLCIDDHSNDTSSSIIENFKESHPNFPIRVLTSTIPSKKAALECGISHTQHDRIITTDADCILPSNWLEAYNTSLQQHNSHFIAGPVRYISDGSFLQAFQHLDFLSLQGVTIAAFQKNVPFLCNGANLCFYKPTFYALNGYEGNKHIASGDDLFLLQKFAKYDNSKLRFLASTDCLVQTHPESTWRSLFSQRMRWVAKTSAVRNVLAISTGAIVFLTNASILVLPFLAPLLAWTLFSAKFVTDLLFLNKSSQFYEKKSPLITVIFSAFLYPVFSTLVVFFSLTNSYTWKGRRYQK